MYRNRDKVLAVLTLAVVVSLGINIVAVSLCPHTGRATNLPAAASEHHACKHESPGAFITDCQTCSHCMMHANTGSAFTFATPATVRDSRVDVPPITTLSSIWSAPAFVSLPDANDHGPPGPTVSRNVLLNVFRI